MTKTEFFRGKLLGFNLTSIQTSIFFKKLRLFSAFENVSGFSYLTYVHYILDVSQILRDNHETIAIREAHPKTTFRGIEMVREPNKTKYFLIIVNSLLPLPWDPGLLSNNPSVVFDAVIY